MKRLLHDRLFKVLEKTMPQEILPTFLGGTNKLGEENICVGGEVDQGILESSKPQDLTGMGKIHCIRIEAGLSHVLTYNTSKQADLRWKFKSDGGDLIFRVEVKRDNKISVLVPSARVWFYL